MSATDGPGDGFQPGAEDDGPSADQGGSGGEGPGADARSSGYHGGHQPPPPIGWGEVVASLTEFIRVSASTYATPPRPAGPDGGPDPLEAHRTEAGDGGPSTPEGCVEWCPICRAADAIRAANQPDTREQLSELQRESILTARAILDHYLDGGSGAGGKPGAPPDRRDAQPDEPDAGPHEPAESDPPSAGPA